MKNLLAVLFILSVSFASVYGQEKAKKNQEQKFAVKGVCKMCKARIESCAMRLKGVKLANWNQENDSMKVVFNTSKIKIEEIHQAIAKIGHETSMLKADEEGYNKLPDCCKYGKVDKH